VPGPQRRGGATEIHRLEPFGEKGKVNRAGGGPERVKQGLSNAGIQDAGPAKKRESEGDSSSIAACPGAPFAVADDGGVSLRAPVVGVAVEARAVLLLVLLVLVLRLFLLVAAAGLDLP
jgi:hypothetical protein